MGWLITKYLLTAAVVVIVSEAAKRSDKLGGFIAALPLVTFLALIWLYLEKQPQARISNHAWYTFWYVVPTLPMFLVFPLLLPPPRVLADPAGQHRHHRTLLRFVRLGGPSVRHSIAAVNGPNPPASTSTLESRALRFSVPKARFRRSRCG